MEKTYTCSSCQSTFTVPLAKVQACYGWIACSVCNLVAQFDESFVSQHQTVSFVLPNLDKNQQNQSGIPVSSGRKDCFDPAATTQPGPEASFEAGVRNTAFPSTAISVVAAATATTTATGTTIDRTTEDVTNTTAVTWPPEEDTSWLSGVHHSIWWQMWCWVGVGLLSFLLLVSIGVMWDRNWVAARWPVTKPWLQAACNMVDCQIQPYRSLENLDILSSSLQLLHYDGEDYILEFVLANRSKTLVLAAPTLTLKLLRPDGKMLLQKTLTKQDISDYPDTLLSQAQWSGRARLQLDLKGSDPQQVSFELTTFYPEAQ